MSATWSIQTPTVTPGAIAVIQLSAESANELEGALARLRIAPIEVGRLAVRDLCGIDRAVVARWTPLTAHLMPHAGPAVLRDLASALLAAGFPEADAGPERTYPEARTPVEARMLAALARAASPLAIDVLLVQPDRWAADPGARTDPARDRILSRLIDPPLVVAIGPPNVGKSSLLNALAGRTVALVADEPGTTRDHVGVLIDAAGLVVRYVDTPGIRSTTDPIESEAAVIAGRVVTAADLVLRCGDLDHPPPPAPAGLDSLVIATRCDLAPPSWPCDVATSALTGAGLADLAAAIRERLVPAAAMTDERPWRFWPPTAEPPI